MNEAKIQLYLTQAFDWCIHVAPSFIGAILFLIIGWWLIGRLEKLLLISMNKRHFEKSLQTFLRTTFALGTKVVLIIMVAGQIGFQTTSLAAIVGAAGLAIGLALQGSLANLAGGVLILIFKPFKVGDIITAGSFSGRVQEIQIFNTILLLPDNKVAILANGGVSNGAIINSHKHDHLRLDLFATLPATGNLTELKASLKKWILRDERILKVPEVHIQIQELAAGKIKLVISVYCAADDLAGIQFEANENILEFYRENGLEF